MNELLIALTLIPLAICVYRDCPVPKRGATLIVDSEKDGYTITLPAPTQGMMFNFYLPHGANEITIK